MKRVGARPLLSYTDASKSTHLSRIYYHPNPLLITLFITILSCQALTTVVDSLSLPESSRSHKRVVLESRRSILRSRIPYVGNGKEDENGQIIGWAIERKIRCESVDDDDDFNEKALEISVNWCHSDDDHPNKDSGDNKDVGESKALISVSLPLNDEDDEQGLSCYLWPSAIAGSILFTSPLYRSFLQNKDILELGSGLGVAGMVAAAAAAEKFQKCVLTDRDEFTVNRLQDIIRQNNERGVHTLGEECSLSACILDWRDFVGLKEEEASCQYDVILGTDLAYYHHLIRPLMDASKHHLKRVKSNNDDNSAEEGGLLCIVGQANRESQWDLYKNIKNGSYNQITDQHEGPWDGRTCLLLYDLGIGQWEQASTQIDNDEQGAPSSLEWNTKEMEEIVPIATILHSMDGRSHESLIGPHDKIATKNDEKDQMMSF